MIIWPAMAESLKSRNHPSDILWSIPEAGHVLGMAEVGPEEYRRKVAVFLDALAARPAQPAQPAAAPLQ